jgi:hypothetical protein
MVSGPTVLECRARATDISEAGCRISVPTNISAGAYVAVEFDQSITGQGWVAWSKNGVIGVHFVVRMSPHAVSRLTESSDTHLWGAGHIRASGRKQKGR